MYIYIYIYSYLSIHIRNSPVLLLICIHTNKQIQMSSTSRPDFDPQTGDVSRCRPLGFGCAEWFPAETRSHRFGLVCSWIMMDYDGLRSPAGVPPNQPC